MDKKDIYSGVITHIVPLFDSCTQCDFEEPESFQGDEKFDEFMDEEVGTQTFANGGNASSSTYSSLTLPESVTCSIDDVPDHKQFNCEIGVRSYLRKVENGDQKWNDMMLSTAKQQEMLAKINLSVEQIKQQLAYPTKEFKICKPKTYNPFETGGDLPLPTSSFDGTRSSYLITEPAHVSQKGPGRMRNSIRRINETNTKAMGGIFSPRGLRLNTSVMMRSTLVVENGN